MRTSALRFRARFALALALILICGVLLQSSAFTGRAPSSLLQTSPASSGAPVTRAPSFFPVGVLEDANLVGSQSARFESMLDDLQARGLNSLLFMNTFAQRDEPLLAISDRLRINVFMLPAGDLNDRWWRAAVPATAQGADGVAQPIVNLFGPHPSFRGYIVGDEPAPSALSKTALLTQSFHELDPARPAMPILIGLDRVAPIFSAAQPDVLLLDVYPLGYHNAPCDFSMTGFGYPLLDFVTYVRAVTLTRPSGTPLWLILQTHRFGQGRPFSLREPSPAEVSVQQWLAVGEGATGIFWFIYGSQQGWTGLADNPLLYPVVTRLARRLAPLRDLLLGLRKIEDRFTVTGGKNPYVSTLASSDGRRWYAVVVNRDCERAQLLSLTSSLYQSRLRDVESAQVYRLGEPIGFQPGDGKVFELVN